MSSESAFHESFDLTAGDRDDGDALVMRGVRWALPMGITFWLAVAMLVWMT